MNAAESTDIKNARTSALEVELFKGRAAPTEAYVAYLSADRSRLTTWMGDTLATIIREKHHRCHRGSMTDERGSFWARGTDGRLYHGRHNGGGMYCYMRLAKVQS